MAKIQDLSTELVLEILEKVLPEDIESFSLASKSLYILAIPRLEEHRALRKQYTNFQNMVEYRPHHWRDPGGLLAELLCKVMTDARMRYYVKKIDLDVWNSGPRGGWKPDAVFDKQISTRSTRLQPDSRTNMEIIEEAVRAVEVIAPGEVNDWLTQIRHGNEDPLVALLLLHATRLNTLKFAVPYAHSGSSYILKTLQSVTMQGPAVQLYPSHLKSVELWFAKKWESPDLIKAFMSLPSLTSIKTESLFVDGRTYEAHSMTLPQPSNVIEMSFRSGSLPHKAFSELLQGVKNLKSFAYDIQDLWGDEDYTARSDFLAVLDSVEANAGQTLECLRLGAEDIRMDQIAPLRRFGTLRNIELWTYRCFAVNEGKPTDLISLLPVSLENLTLAWYETTSADGVELLTETILGWIRESKTRLPHLRTLAIITMDHMALDALWDCLSSEQTARINPMLSFKIRGPGGGGEIIAWADNVCICGQDCFGGNLDEPLTKLAACGLEF